GLTFCPNPTGSADLKGPEAGTPTNVMPVYITCTVFALFHPSYLDNLQKNIEIWLERNDSHPHYAAMLEFKNQGYQRKASNLKKIRNDLIHIMGSRITWEAAIGKTIGLLVSENKLDEQDSDNIINYLGKEFVAALTNSMK
ncbi:MAG: hypothetical protein K2Q14_03150, partial [Gammaproteobacteria bacterium]|nr:hypothetical protein [Gammaproteobacteria bacterium]